MKLIDISSDVGLRMDTDDWTIAKEREDLIFYSLEAIGTQIDEYDVIATGLVNSLVANQPLIETYPGRERAHYWAGLWTNAFYGFTVAMILLALVTIMLRIRGGI